MREFARFLGGRLQHCAVSVFFNVGYLHKGLSYTVEMETVVIGHFKGNLNDFRGIFLLST